MKRAGLVLASGLFVLGACRRTELLCELPAERGATATGASSGSAGGGATTTGGSGGAGGATSAIFRWLLPIGRTDVVGAESIDVGLDGDRVAGCLRANGFTPGVAALGEGGGSPLAGDEELSLVCFGGILGAGAPQLGGSTAYGDAPSKLVVAHLAPGSSTAFAVAGIATPRPGNYLGTYRFTDGDCLLPSCLRTTAPGAHGFVLRASKDDASDGELAHLTCRDGASFALTGVAVDAEGTWVSGLCRELRVEVEQDAETSDARDAPFLVGWSNEGELSFVRPASAGALSFDEDGRLILSGLAGSPDAPDFEITRVLEAPETPEASIGLVGPERDVVSLWPDRRHATLLNRPCGCSEGVAEGLIVATCTDDDDSATRCDEEECAGAGTVTLSPSAGNRFASALSPSGSVLLAVETDVAPPAGSIVDVAGIHLVEVDAGATPRHLHTLGTFGDAGGFEGFRVLGMARTDDDRVLAWGHGVGARDPTTDVDGYFLGELRLP